MRLLGVAVLLASCLAWVAAQDENAPPTKGIGKEWGPWVWPTRGEVWPKPRSITSYQNQGYMTVSTNTFRFNVSHSNLYFPK